MFFMKYYSIHFYFKALCDNNCLACVYFYFSQDISSETSETKVKIKWHITENSIKFSAL